MIYNASSAGGLAVAERPVPGAEPLDVATGVDVLADLDEEFVDVKVLVTLAPVRMAEPREALRHVL